MILPAAAGKDTSPPPAISCTCIGRCFIASVMFSLPKFDRSWLSFR